MLKLFNAFKKNNNEKQQKHVYRQYTSGQLKIIAMRTRMIFQEIYKKQSLKVSHSDNQFKKVQKANLSTPQQYQVLQQIGKKVIEAETIKLFIQLLRKIQSYSPQLMATKGDVTLLKQQIKWFQCVLWYRKIKNLNNIEQFNKFCFNFFKGVDITHQINLKCEIFQIYPDMVYLTDQKVVPLDLTVQKVIPFVSFQIQPQQLDQMKKINTQQLKKQDEKQKIKTIADNPFIHFNKNKELPPTNSISKNNNSQTQSKKNPIFPENIPEKKNPLISQPECKDKIVDDQFAVDPFSNVRSTPAHLNQNQNQLKKFQSPNLNLIDWQTLYSQEGNPYAHSSKKNQNDASYNYSQSSEYDQNTLPYPPSGVLPVDVEVHGQIGDQNRSSLFDTLDNYIPQPVSDDRMKQLKQGLGQYDDISFQINKSEEKNMQTDDISYVRKMEEQFFGKPGQNRQKYCKTMDVFGQNEGKHKQFNGYKSFNEQDLLKQRNEPIKKQGSQKKSFNRLFGFKMKSQPQNEKPKHHSNQNISQNKSSQTPNGYKIQYNPGCAANQNKNPYDQICKNNQTNKFSSDNQIDQMLSSMNDIDSNNNIDFGVKKNNNNQTQNEQIFNLINSHKKQLAQSHTQKDQFDNLLEQNEQKQSQQRFSMDKRNQYADLLDEFQNNLRFDQKFQKKNSFNGQSEQDFNNKTPIEKQQVQEKIQNQANEQLPDLLRIKTVQKPKSFAKSQQRLNQLQKQKSQQLSEPIIMHRFLQKDLFQSLMIIRRCFGETEISSQNQYYEDQKKPVDVNKTQPIKKKVVKKPYMVSIYARQQFMDMMKTKMSAQK